MTVWPRMDAGAVSFSSVIKPLLNVDSASAHWGVALQLLGW